jgi:DNA-binding CsgD family transcriptional regulator
MLRRSPTKERSDEVGLRGQLSHPESPGQHADRSEIAAYGEHETTIRARTAGQKQTRLTASQINELLAIRETGATIAELAMRFDIHRTTVMAHLKRNSPHPSPISMRPR